MCNTPNALRTEKREWLKAGGVKNISEIKENLWQIQKNK